MAITAVGQATGAGVNGGTTGGITTTGANLLIVNIGSGLGLAGTVADSKGNTWFPITSPSTNVVNNALYYAWAPVVGTGHTVTVTAVGGAASFEFMAFSGAQSASDPLDQSTYKPLSGTYQPAPPTSIQTAAGVTPTTDNQLIIMGYGSNNTSATPGAFSDSLIQLSFVLFAGGSNYASGIGYKVQTTAAAINPTYTPTADGDSDYLSAVLATFKAAPTATVKSLAALGVG